MGQEAEGRDGSRIRGRPVSQREIARCLGLSQSAVSLALRGVGSVPEETRSLVVRKARELGYSPDPKLDVLRSYRDAVSGGPHRPVLAWMTNYPEKDQWKTGEGDRYFAGAKQRAEELGFELREFWLQDPSRSMRSVRERMLAEGVCGVLVAPQETAGIRIEFDFAGFIPVAIGFTLESPILHRVGSYALGSVRLAVRSLRELGYRRIGLVLEKEADTRTANAYSGGFLSVEASPRYPLLPPLVAHEIGGDAFGRWFEDWRPDAIVGTLGDLKMAEAWLGGQGLAVGEDVALAGLRVPAGPGPYAGIDPQSELIGKIAVNRLYSDFGASAYGIPSCPTQILVDGVWFNGASALPKMPRPQTDCTARG